MAGTVAAIQRELMWEGFVARYRTHRDFDGLPPGEGVFLPCTFWLADNLLALGRRTSATPFRAISRPGLGLFSEEYDPRARRFLVNFPQAFTHVALVDSAFNLWHPDSPVRHRKQS